MSVSWLKVHEQSCTLSIFVQAGAKTSGIVGEHGEYLKIRVAAPRVEGLANESLLEYMSKLLQVGKKDLVILKGEFGKYKVIEIRKISAEEIMRVLAKQNKC